jgi:small subunit ribosomal protein S20
MANIKSQIKRIKQNAKATERNKGKRSALKTLITKFNKAVEDKDKKQATELFATTSKSLDKATSAGVHHANRAAAKKSALSKKLSTLK